MTRQNRLRLGGAIGVVVCVGVLAYEVGHAGAEGIPQTNTLFYNGTLQTFGAPDNSAHNMVLALYVQGSTSSSTPLCTTGTVSVTCVNGQFSIPLSATCVTAIHQNPDIAVEMTVDGVALGMVSVSAVPFAVEADTASNAAVGSPLATQLASVVSASAPAIVASGTALTLGPVAAGEFLRVSLTANTTLTLPTVSPAAGTALSFNVDLIQDSTGSRTVTWAVPSGNTLTWSGSATAPALATAPNARTRITFVLYSGDTVWRGVVTYTDAVPSGISTFTCTGVDQAFTVPIGVAQVTAKLWGAGGAGGATAGDASSVGGGGGYATAQLSVTSGQVLTVVAGCGGLVATTSDSCTGPEAGAGGGRSAIRTSTGAELVTAGGGGGAAGCNGCSAAGGNDSGGAGGGTQGSAGANGTNTGIAGGGGSQSGGGAVGGIGGGTLENGGPTGGAQYQGGRGNGYADGATATYGGGGAGGACYGGGGGGGGYYGGGGGGSNAGGGGGSGFVSSGGTQAAGNSQTPGNVSDADRAGAGNGGALLQAGSTGLVQIAWGNDSSL